MTKQAIEKIRAWQKKAALFMQFLTEQGMTESIQFLKEIEQLAIEPHVHYFEPEADNDKFCKACGEYLTSEFHQRA